MPPAKLCDKAIVQCDIDRYRRDQLHQRYVRPPESAQQRTVEIKEERCGQTDENDHTPVCKILRYDLPRPCSGTTTRASPCEPTPTPQGRSKTRPHKRWAASWRRSCEQNKTKNTGEKAKASSPVLFKSFYAFRCVGHGVGQAVDPHFDPHLKVHFCNEKHPKSEDFRCFLELLTRFELVTSSLPRMRSTD